MSSLTERAFGAVIFDLDGTLIDSTASVVRSWRRWAEEEGIDPQVLAGMHGIPARGIIERVLPPQRWESGQRRIDALEIEDVEGITPLPGAVSALAVLADSAVTPVTPSRSAIATSCTGPLARARIEAAGLAAPAVVVTVDDVERGKPHPDPFLAAAARLGLDPRDCLVVEDAPSGLEAARAAGCATLAVTTTTAREVLTGSGWADLVVGTLAEVDFRVGDSVTVVVTGR